MSLLERELTRKRRVNNNVTELEVGDIKTYKVKTIRNSAVYKMELDGHLSGLYYLVFSKGYLKEKNTKKLSSAVLHLQKLISLFHKDHWKKPIAISLPKDSALLIARSTIRPTKLVPKQKRGQLAKSVSKRAKKNWAHV